MVFGDKDWIKWLRGVGDSLTPDPIKIDIKMDLLNEFREDISLEGDKYCQIVCTIYQCTDDGLQFNTPSIADYCNEADRLGWDYVMTYDGENSRYTNGGYRLMDSQVIMFKKH